MQFFAFIFFFLEHTCILSWAAHRSMYGAVRIRLLNTMCKCSLDCFGETMNIISNCAFIVQFIQCMCDASPPSTLPTCPSPSPSIVPSNVNAAFFASSLIRSGSDISSQKVVTVIVATPHPNLFTNSPAAYVCTVPHYVVHLCVKQKRTSDQIK